jgi:hypothetical protein
MECFGCGSATVSERSERTAQGYRRFRCRACDCVARTPLLVAGGRVAAHMGKRIPLPGSTLPCRSNTMLNTTHSQTPISGHELA